MDIKTAYMQGYEKGHHDTVEGGTFCPEESADDWIAELVIESRAEPKTEDPATKNTIPEKNRQKEADNLIQEIATRLSGGNQIRAHGFIDYSMREYLSKYNYPTAAEEN